jgi:hypothetical protein
LPGGRQERIPRSSRRRRTENRPQPSPPRKRHVIHGAGSNWNEKHEDETKGRIDDLWGGLFIFFRFLCHNDSEGGRRRREWSCIIPRNEANPVATNPLAWISFSQFLPCWALAFADSGRLMDRLVIHCGMTLPTGGGDGFVGR